MRAEVALRVQIVEPEAQRLVAGHVPVELRDQLVVVGVEEIALILAGTVVRCADHPLADCVHHARLDSRYAESGCRPRSRDEVRAGILRALDLAVDVIEQAVLHDRTAERQATLGVRKVAVGDDPSPWYSFALDSI